MDERNNMQDDTDTRDKELDRATQTRSRAETGEISEDESMEESRSELGAGE